MKIREEPKSRPRKHLDGCRPAASSCSSLERIQHPDARRADRAAQNTVEQLQQEIAQKQNEKEQLEAEEEEEETAESAETSADTAEPDPTASLPDYVLHPDMEMPVMKIDGNYYIGVFTIPSLDLSLPVMED